MDYPTNTPREDSPASGPSPEVQVPGKTCSPEPIPADDEQPEPFHRKRMFLGDWMVS